MARSSAQWAKVRAAYRRGEGSYRELSEKFGIPEQTIRKRAAREKWVKQRNETGARAEQQAREKDVESLAAMLAKHRRLANRLLQLAEKRIEQAAASKKGVSAGMLDTMAQVLSRAARQERLAAGIEPAKPVMGFETAAPGTVLRVTRKRAAEVPGPKAAT